jgi:hypothetical protein
MAFGASTAQAVVVRDGIHPLHAVCPNVQASGSTVTGGCLVEDMAGTFDLVAGGYTFATDCYTTFDMRVEGDSDYWAVDNTTSCTMNSTPNGRQECRDSSGAARPWPSGPTSGTMNICLEYLPTGSEAWYDVNFAYTLGYSGQLEMMTQRNPITNWITGAQFVNQGTSEEIRITAS